MRSAWLRTLVLVALAALASACGASTKDDGAPKTLEGDLRLLADGAPHGDRAYWLGPTFSRTPVSFVSPGWGRYALLTYHENFRVDVDVESFPKLGGASGRGTRVRVRTATGQDVVIVFRKPLHPSAAMVRAARAALQPIPLHVSYPG